MSSPFPSGVSLSTMEITPCDAVTASMQSTVAVNCDYGDDVVDVLELDDEVDVLEGVVVLDDVSGTVVVVVLVVGLVVVVASTMRCPNDLI